MSEGRQQTMMEVWPIARHLKELREKYECENLFQEGNRRVIKQGR